MSNPFQEQLLKAGLTTENKIKQTNQAKRKKAKQQKGKFKELDESKLLAQKAEEEKRERDRELNRQKEETLKQKAIVAQIKQLIDMNKINLADSEVSYNFEDNNIVKRLYVTDTLHEQISNGRLSIVKFDEKYNVVPTAVANKIKERDASYIVVLNDSSASEQIDEEYADYQIPDDLMW